MFLAGDRVRVNPNVACPDELEEGTTYTVLAPVFGAVPAELWLTDQPVPYPERLFLLRPNSERRFEFREGTSDKVWIVYLSATNELVTEWGRRGYDRQMSVKPQSSHRSALAARNKLIGEKLTKGYVEVT